MLDLSRLPISPQLANRGTQMWTSWKALAEEQRHLRYTVTIALVGKYTSNADSYVPKNPSKFNDETEAY